MKKTKSLPLFFILFIALFSCKKEKATPSFSETNTAPGEQETLYKDIPQVGAGSDIFLANAAGKYRYGPSIIINQDGSIDAWFAAPGELYYGDVSLFNEAPDKVAVQIEKDKSAGQKFTVSTKLYRLMVMSPTWSASNSKITLRLYAWNSDYNTTVGGQPLAEQAYVNYKDNALLDLVSTEGFPAGTYLWVMSDPNAESGGGKTGLWKYPQTKTGTVSYLNGVATAGSYRAFLQTGKNDATMYWDQVAYRRSTDGGKTWTADVMVLKPTLGTRDQLSVCDPGVAKWGGYYYIGYTSTDGPEGTHNNAFVCRSEKPDGPWEKWNGTGWGGSPQPVVEYTGDPTKFGAGEPCMVVNGGKIYFYFTWKAGGSEGITTRVATADESEVNWPAHLTQQGTAINATQMPGSDHCDIKYRDDLNKFQAIHTASRMGPNSYIVLWESSDGIHFSKTEELRDESLKPYLHNCGWSGDEKGHINPEIQQYISYAYGSEWATWNTAWHPLHF